MDLLPTRFHAITRSIQLRQAAEFRRQADLQTAATRHVVAAVHAAAGNKSGAKRADKLELVKPDVTVAAPEVSTEKAVRMFGPPMIPPED